ncbi:hypothetical protein GUH43_15905, partial [Xanthomonas citri pv. citri]|nr:hypothetical protein [Xanthomonas citri pv. citri]
MSRLLQISHPARLALVHVKERFVLAACGDDSAARLIQGIGGALIGDAAAGRAAVLSMGILPCPSLHAEQARRLII